MLTQFICRAPLFFSALGASLLLGTLLLVLVQSTPGSYRCSGRRALAWKKGSQVQLLFSLIPELTCSVSPLQRRLPLAPTLVSATTDGLTARRPLVALTRKRVTLIPFMGMDKKDREL